MLFRIEPLRFSFVAREAIHFPAGKSANILRGAFGTIFRRIACLPQCQGASECAQRAACPYARLFEPVGQSGPSGLADHPRPFVFRAMHLDRQTFAAGQAFHFDMNLFDTDPATIGYLTSAFEQLAREGLGPRHSKVELTAVETRVLTLELAPIPSVAVSPIRVRFVTPTELKSGEQLAARPEFGILATRARDRLSMLRTLYGDGPLEIDFRAFGERANAVVMTRREIREVAVERRSSKTGQTHSIGGFVGEAEYEGDLGEFVPYLIVAQWTGVGRQTVWGKGEIAVLQDVRAVI